jgi:hypothetical protein
MIDAIDILMPVDPLFDTFENSDAYESGKTQSLEDIVFANDLYHSKYDQTQVIPRILFTN